MKYFVRHTCTLEAGPNKQKHKIFFFFTEPLIYGEMGDMSTILSKRHA